MHYLHHLHSHGTSGHTSPGENPAVTHSRSSVTRENHLPYRSLQLAVQKWAKNCAPYKSVILAERSLAFTRFGVKSDTVSVQNHIFVVIPRASKTQLRSTSHQPSPPHIDSTVSFAHFIAPLVLLLFFFCCRSRRIASSRAARTEPWLQKGSPSGRPTPVCFQCDSVPQRQRQQHSLGPTNIQHRILYRPFLLKCELGEQQLVNGIGIVLVR